MTPADHPAAALLERLVSAGPRFDFVPALRICEAALPGRPRIGHLGPVEDESVRLRPALELAFPTADVAGVREVQTAGGLRRFEVSTTFLGLYGQASPLPTYFTENLMAQDERGLARGVLDLFHHRLLALCYRALTKYGVEAHDRHLLALIGQAGDGGAADPGLAACAGLLAQNPRSAMGLQAALSFWFGGTPVEVEQCCPCWTALPAAQQARLGLANAALGRDCSLGARVFNRSTSFRIAIGPLDAQAFAGFLPGGPALGDLQRLVAEFNGERLDYVVEVAIAAAELPPARLGGGQRLGWDSRLAGTASDRYRVTFATKA